MDRRHGSGFSSVLSKEVNIGTNSESAWRELLKADRDETQSLREGLMNK